jgi:hypothetical protein
LQHIGLYLGGTTSLKCLLSKGMQSPPMQDQQPQPTSGGGRCDQFYLLSHRIGEISAGKQSISASSRLAFLLALVLVEVFVSWRCNSQQGFNITSSCALICAICLQKLVQPTVQTGVAAGDFADELEGDKARCAQCNSKSFQKGTDHHCGILGVCIHDANRAQFCTLLLAAFVGNTTIMLPIAPKFLALFWPFIVLPMRVLTTECNVLDIACYWKWLGGSMSQLIYWGWCAAGLGALSVSCLFWMFEQALFLTFQRAVARNRPCCGVHKMAGHTVWLIHTIFGRDREDRWHKSNGEGTSPSAPAVQQEPGEGPTTSIWC